MQTNVPVYYNINSHALQQTPAQFLNQMQQTIPLSQANYNNLSTKPQPAISQQYLTNLPQLPATPDHGWPGWTTVSRNPKKRGRENSPEGSSSQQVQTNANQYCPSKPITTSNRFNSLQDETLDEATTDQTEQTDKPPPKFVEDVQVIQPLTELLNKTAPNSYTLKS